MMTLSTMWNVDRTVDAEGRSPVADRILGHWPRDAGSARLVRSSANFVYACRSGGLPCFLRFADAAERTRAAIEAEVAIVHWLAASGLHVARPLPSHQGAFVETATTEVGTFHAVLFAARAGDHRDLADLAEPDFGDWGAALGTLHASLRRYPGLSAAARPTWRDHLAFADAHTSMDQLTVRTELNLLVSALASLPTSQDTYGLIHGDFELDNLVWQGQTIGMLDFDDCAHHWYVADIAFALRDLFDPGADLADPRVRAFLAGYARHHVLDDHLLPHLPLFSRLARLLTYAKIARALDISPADDHPDWLLSLIHRFRSRMVSYETSLAATIDPSSA